MSNDEERELAILDAEQAMEFGNVERTSSNYDQALVFYQQATQLYRTYNARSGEGIALSQSAGVLTVQGKLEEALEYYGLALTIHREMGNKRHEGETLGNIGITLRHTGALEQALIHYELALKIHRELGNARFEGITLISLGETYRQLGRYSEATNYYRQALETTQRYGNRRAQGVILNNLGLILRAQGDHKNAIESFKDGLTITQEIGDVENQGTTLGNIGDCFFELGLLDQAQHYLELSISICTEIEYQIAVGVFGGSLAHLLAKQGDTAKALSMIADSEPMVTAFPHELGKFICRKGFVQHCCGQAEHAQASLAAAIQIATTLKVQPTSELTVYIDKLRDTLNKEDSAT